MQSRLKTSFFLRLSVAATFIAATTLGQNGPEARHQQATNHLRLVAAEISSRSLTNINSLTDWEAERPRLRAMLLDSLGLNPLPARSPLKARITGRMERPGYTIEKLAFQSLPGLYVTGNFYLPNDRSTPLPTILYLCGHAPHPRGAKFNYQDRALWFAKNGFACLILDTLEFGEVPGIHHGLHDLNMWHWLSLGYTPAGTEVWNAIRAIDYLGTREEVDSKRIGLTGISGGGAITWFTAAVDDRVAAAVPVCSTYTFGSQAMHWRAFGQCDCIYFHNTYQIGFPVVAALIAPRPLLMISGRKDSDFPPDGYHEVFRRSKRIYQLHGKSEQVGELDDDVGHSDPPQFRRAAREWMRRWLQDDTTPLPLIDHDPAPETADDLACLDELPPDAINHKVHNLFTRTTKVSRSTRVHGARRAEMISGLKKNVFRWFPTNEIPFATQISRNSGGWLARYGNYREVTFETEPGVRIRAQVISPTNRVAATPLLLYVKRPGDSIYAMDFDELLPVFNRYTVVILNPRFTERSLTAAEYRDIEMTAAWTGRTIAAMQAWDVLRTLKWIQEEEKIAPAAISIYGKGKMGILALYVALLEDRVAKIILNNPPASHWNDPALLNVLRITDIPELVSAVGRNKIVSVGPTPANLRTRVAGSLPEAIAQR